MDSPTGRVLFSSRTCHFSTIAPVSDNGRRPALLRLEKKPLARPCPPLLLVAALLLAACAEEHPAEPEEAAVPAPRQGCGQEGFLSAALYGSIDRALHWEAAELDCDSMLRPNGKGVRFRFTGDAADQEVAIILAMPDLERGRDGEELPTVITLSVAGSGRFFSTPRSDTCFADVDLLPHDTGAGALYVASGTLYCTAPLGEINGDAAVSIPRLEFRTRVAWSDRES